MSLLGCRVITGVASAAGLGHGMLISGGGDFALLSWAGVVMVVASMGKADWINICSARLKQSWPVLVAVSIEPAANSVVRRPTTDVPRTADFRQVRRRQAERPVEASQRERHRSGRPAATAAKRPLGEERDVSGTAEGAESRDPRSPRKDSSVTGVVDWRRPKNEAATQVGNAPTAYASDQPRKSPPSLRLSAARRVQT